MQQRLPQLLQPIFIIAQLARTAPVKVVCHLLCALLHCWLNVNAKDEDLSLYNVHICTQRPDGSVRWTF